MPRTRRIESVFLNIPYDGVFENLYLAYIVGLTQLGLLQIKATLAVPNQGRLSTIINVTHGRHRVFVFESKRYRAQPSTSDVNGIDPQIHSGTPKGLMSGLRNIFRQPRDVTTVPEMLSSYRAVKQKLPQLRRNSGGKSLFEAAVFQDLTVAALLGSEKLIARRST